MSGTTESNLTLIGIGSSAGGLEAIRQLVSALPNDLPVSYVVVQHMSPHHKSLMTSLVARETNLEVRDVTDDIIPEANVIYITPPNHDIILKEGALRLVEPSPEVASPKPSVDRFLISLAQDHGEKSMAIILSGTGSDGAYGVQAIREVGGITMAQDNDSAKYDGMPQSAVQTGCVDLILPPPAIGEHLPKILTSPRDLSGFRSGDLDSGPHSDLLQILLARTQVDFRDYKQTTIGRRIERRMVALNIKSEEEYTQFCRSNPSAVDALFKDLLISVTRFFRDREAFDQLAKLLPKLIEQNKEDQIRIWIAGCATGEEAYSIAMLMCEALDGSLAEFKSKVQIFATDIDKEALTVARRGSYGLSALNDIPPEFAKKYLVRQNEEVRVVDALRGSILFSDHNVCQAPPFQKIDLLCCRNLLIYFSNALQKKVMGRFHYSMRKNALMFLGTAESVAGSDELFVEDRDATHVFRKRTLHKSISGGYQMPNMPLTHEPRRKPAVNHEPSTDRQLLKALAASLGPNSMMVTEEYFIAEVFGDVSPYVSLSNSTNLRMHIDLLRRPLREEARSLITIALKNGKRRSGVRHLLAEDDSNQVMLEVYPIVAKEINERAALLVFKPIETEPESKRLKTVSAGDSTETSQRINALENEVATTREALQQTIEELETSNEELQSLNEELQSTNEELQATNEELETSNEELQSTNEELITVNEELQITSSELMGRTSELASVLQNSPLAMLVTDNALQVTQCTDSAAKLFDLAMPIVSPHISQCALPEGYPALSATCSECLRLGEIMSHEFSHRGARVLLTCSPYFNAQRQISGVTVVVTEFPGMASEMEMILRSAQFHLMQRTREGKILRVSSVSAKILGSTPQEMAGGTVADYLDEETAKMIEERDAELLDTGIPFSDRTIPVKRRGSSEVTWLQTHAVKYYDKFEKCDTAYAMGIDVTDVVTKQREAEELAMTKQLVQEMADIGNWVIDIVANEVYWSPEVHRIHGTDPASFVPDVETGIDFYHPDDRADVEHIVSEAIEHGKQFEFTKRLVAKNKKIIEVHAFGMPMLDDNGKPLKIIGVFREIPPAKKRAKA